MGNIVLYTNVKGGVGKTTLCGIFATYLANSGRTVAVVDADLQQSLFRHRKRDLQQNPDASLPWEINTLRGGMSTNKKDGRKELNDIHHIVLLLHYWCTHLFMIFSSSLLVLKFSMFCLQS